MTSGELVFTSLNTDSTSKISLQFTTSTAPGNSDTSNQLIQTRFYNTNSLDEVYQGVAQASHSLSSIRQTWYTCTPLLFLQPITTFTNMGHQFEFNDLVVNPEAGEQDRAVWCSDSHQQRSKRVRRGDGRDFANDLAFVWSLNNEVDDVMECRLASRAAFHPNNTFIHPLVR